VIFTSLQDRERKNRPPGDGLRSFNTILEIFNLPPTGIFKLKASSIISNVNFGKFKAIKKYIKYNSILWSKN